MATVVGDLVTGAINAYNQYTANKTNEEIARENIQATKEINAQNLEHQDYWNRQTQIREDNAIQRSAKDAQLAGLSKTLGIGGASASALNAANMQVPLNTYKRNPEHIDTSMLDLAQRKANIEATNASTEATEAQTEQTKVETKNAEISGKLKAEELSFTIFENDYWRDKQMPPSAQNKYLDAVNAIEYAIDRWFTSSPTADADVDSLLPADSGVNNQNVVNTAVSNPEMHAKSTDGKHMAVTVQDAEETTVQTADGKTYETYKLSNMPLEGDFVARYGNQAIVSCTASDNYFDLRDWAQSRCYFKDSHFGCKDGDFDVEFAKHSDATITDLMQAYGMSRLMAQITVYTALALELD